MDTDGTGHFLTTNAHEWALIRSIRSEVDREEREGTRMGVATETTEYFYR